jgi:hypothetical protein
MTGSRSEGLAPLYQDATSGLYVGIRVPYSRQDLAGYGGKSEPWSLSRSRAEVFLTKISHSAKRT